MKRKFMLQVVAWLLTVAMLLPSANAALTTAYAAGEKAAYTGSATFTASGEWAEKELTMKDLIGNVNPDDVAYISFTSDAKFNVGYNPADHSAWKWANYSTKHDVSDIALDGWFAFKFALNANDGKSYTIKWSVYTGDAKAPAQEQGQEETDKNANVVFSNSVTFSDASWWTAYEIRDRAFLIGDVKPEDVAYVKFTSDTTFLIGYNNGGGYFQRETDSPVTTWVARDINWDLTEFFLQLMLSKGDGKNYTIKWDVVSKIAATPTPTPTPTATPTPTPVPKYTDVGETLTVTEDMVKNGVVTIKNAQYDEIIVPAGLGITKINFNIIDVEKLVFEGGENYTVNLRNALVEETEFAAPKVKEMTYEELVKELEKAREAEDASAAVTAVANAFVASLQAKSKAAEAQIKLNAYDSELDSVSVKANARIDVTEASVKDLAVSTKEASQRMEVRVTGFNGDAKIDLDKGGRTYNAPLSLTFRESAVDKLDVTGNEIFHVEGSKSTVDTMTLSGVNSVSSNLDAANLVVDEKNENANVRVYSDVANLIVEGEKNDVVLPACASIENAIVAGDNIRVYGLGELGNAEVTGTGANVATIGTAVEGENNTTMPQAMIEMLPTATPVPAKPAPVEYKLSFSGSEVIKPFNLYKFDGNITVTVDFAVTAGAAYSQFKPMTTWWTGMFNKDTGENNFVGLDVATSGTPTYLNADGYIFISDATATSVSFTINPTGIQLLKDQGGLTFHQQGLTITKVTLSGEKAANGGYIGDDKVAYELSEGEMASYAGKALKVELGYAFKSGTNNGTITVFYKNPDYSWSTLTAADFVDFTYTVNQWKQIELPAGTATFIVGADAVDNAIAGKGLGIQVNRNVILNSVKISVVDVTPENPDTPDTPSEPQEPEVVITSKDGKGAITFADKEWWTTQEISLTDLLAGVAADKVESITFTSDTGFVVGYNNTTGDSTNENPWWSQHEGKTSYTVSNIAFEKFTDSEGGTHEFALKIALSKGDGVKYTINWTITEKTESGDDNTGDGNEGGGTTPPVINPDDNPTGSATGGAIVTPTPGAGGEEDDEEEGENTPTTTPDPTPVVKEISLYAEYPGSGNHDKYVTADVLALFKGAVALDLEYAMAGKDSVWYNVVNSNPWGNLKLAGQTSFNKDKTKMTVVVSAEDVAAMVNKGAQMKFQVSGMYFTKVTLRDATPDDYYVGEFNVSNEFTKDALNIAEGNDVKVTVTYKVVSTAKKGDYWLQISDTGSEGWPTLNSADKFVEPSFKVENWGGITLDGSKTEFTFTISEATYAAMNKIALRPKNVIIESVKFEAIEKPEPTPVIIEIELDSALPEPDENGNRASSKIPAEKFEQFKEKAIAVTLEYTKLSKYPYYDVRTAWYGALTPEGETNVGGEHAVPYSEDVTFVLDADDVALICAQGGLYFPLREIYFTKVIIREATSDDYYVGDRNVAAVFEADVLKALGGHAKITLTYRTIKDYPYYNIFLQHTDKDGWDYLGKNAFVEASLENKDNCFSPNEGDTTLTMVLSQDTINALQSKLQLGVYGVIIESMDLEAIEVPAPTPTVQMATDIYDFRDGSVVPTNTPGNVPAASEDGKVTVGVGTEHSYRYHGTQYGVEFQKGNSISIDVNGNATIEVNDCVHNAEDELIMTSADGSWTQAKKAKVSDSNILTFEYEGEATTLTLAFTAKTYITCIKVTMADLPDPVTYNLLNGDIVPTTTENGTSTLTSEDGKLTIKLQEGSQNGYSYNNQHGTVIKAGVIIELVVPGAVKVDVADCQYNVVKSLMMTSADGSWTQTVDSTGKSSATCNTTMSFIYTGEATTLILSADNTAYITSIKVTPIAK